MLLRAGIVLITQVSPKLAAAGGSDVKQDGICQRPMSRVPPRQILAGWTRRTAAHPRPPAGRAITGVWPAVRGQRLPSPGGTPAWCHPSLAEAGRYCDM